MTRAIKPGTGVLRISIPGFLLAVLLLPACSTQKELSSTQRTAVGILCVIGNEPFTNLSFQTEGGTMVAILKDTTATYRELRKLQGQKLKVQFTSIDSSIRIERYEIVKKP